jgi:hypothetical protein
VTPGSGPGDWGSSPCPGVDKRPANVWGVYRSKWRLESRGDVSLYWKIIVRELRELAWNLGRRTGR